MHEQSEARKEQQPGFIVETIRFALMAALIVLPIRYFIAQPFIVSGSSMVPTFENGEYLIVDQISYRFEPPQRGDVIIFKYPLNPKKYFIKRIVGLPGETLTFSGTRITGTTAEGAEFEISETYVINSREEYRSLTLGPDEYYVLGDNRPASSDSRVWGPLPKDNIIGRPIVRLLPFSRIDVFPGISPAAQ